MMFRGGLDERATPHVALSVIQLDWLSPRSNGISDNNNAPISTALLFRY
jgi:hypothetical protein